MLCLVTCMTSRRWTIWTWAPPQVWLASTLHYNYYYHRLWHRLIVEQCHNQGASHLSLVPQAAHLTYQTPITDISIEQLCGLYIQEEAQSQNYKHQCLYRKLLSAQLLKLDLDPSGLRDCLRGFLALSQFSLEIRSIRYPWLPFILIFLYFPRGSVDCVIPANFALSTAPRIAVEGGVS